jgi:hypothetical protein
MELLEGICLGGFRNGIKTYSHRAFLHESLAYRAPAGHAIN